MSDVSLIPMSLDSYGAESKTMFPSPDIEVWAREEPRVPAEVGKLDTVKKLAGRLGLQTRRDSYVQWLDNLEHNPDFSRFSLATQKGPNEEDSSRCREVLDNGMEQNNNIMRESPLSPVSRGRRRNSLLPCPGSFPSTRKASMMTTLQTLGENEEEDFSNDNEEADLCRWKAWARGDHSNSDSSNERERQIGKALNWIKREIVSLKQWDDTLARTFIILRTNISQTKLDLNRCKHQIMLDEAELDAEESRMSRESWFLPEPEEVEKPKALRSIGITDMNWTARRFSMR